VAEVFTPQALGQAFSGQVLMLPNGLRWWTSAARRMKRGSFEMIDWLTKPLAYEFMQRGLAASTLVGVLCAVVGCYVVLRGMAFLGDALAHAILPGVALAYLFNGNLLIGALAAAIVVALLIGFLSRQGTIKEDTAIGILFARRCRWACC